jgi:hypothetical protein
MRVATSGHLACRSRTASRAPAPGAPARGAAPPARCRCLQHSSTHMASLFAVLPVQEVRLAVH